MLLEILVSLLYRSGKVPVDRQINAVHQGELAQGSECESPLGFIEHLNISHTQSANRDTCNEHLLLEFSPLDLVYGIKFKDRCIFVPDQLFCDFIGLLIDSLVFESQESAIHSTSFSSSKLKKPLHHY